MKSHLAILIVNEKVAEQDAIGAAFSFLGYKNPLVYASGAETCLRFLDEVSSNGARREPLPGLILLDLELGKDCGLLLLETLKKHPMYCQIPAVVLSTPKCPLDISKAYELGCGGFFQKPVDADGYKKIVEIIYQFWLGTFGIASSAE